MPNRTIRDDRFFAALQEAIDHDHNPGERRSSLLSRRL